MFQIDIGKLISILMFQINIKTDSSNRRRIQCKDQMDCRTIDGKLTSISQIKAVLILFNKMDVNLVSKRRFTNYIKYTQHPSVCKNDLKLTTKNQWWRPRFLQSVANRD